MTVKEKILKHVCEQHVFRIYEWGVLTKEHAFTYPDGLVSKNILDITKIYYGDLWDDLSEGINDKHEQFKNTKYITSLGDLVEIKPEGAHLWVYINGV